MTFQCGVLRPMRRILHIRHALDFSAFTMAAVLAVYGGFDAERANQRTSFVRTD